MGSQIWIQKIRKIKLILKILLISKTSINKYLYSNLLYEMKQPEEDIMTKSTVLNTVRNLKKKLVPYLNPLLISPSQDKIREE